LLDLQIVENNLKRTVETCRAHGVAYRPHIKTHKMPVLARKQVEAGAVGITCAKVSEAEVMAAAGLQDIFVANCLVDRNRFERLMRLSRDHRLKVGVDSAEAATAMSEFFASQGRTMDVVMEIDTGHHRCGVLPAAAPDLGKHLATLAGIKLKGVFTHEGHVYGAGAAEIANRGKAAGEEMVRTAKELGSRGIAVEVVSVGSSPARDATCKVKGITEHRPGTNIFNDCTQVHLGSCEWNDCALSYLCTVISRPAADRAIIDGGSKTFSSDKLSDWGGLGAVKGQPGAQLSKASEEHGFLTLTDEASNRLAIGDRVNVIPSHACGSMNLHSRAYVVRGDEVVEEWKIEARGCVN
jgi:D-serine deaminase-like pyridoxal phosphate-dependent protein